MFKLLFVFVFLLGALVHLSVGNSPEMITNDLFKGVILFGLGIIAVYLFLLAVSIWLANPQIWERNRQAALLCKKVRRGNELTSCEEVDYNSFLVDGIIVETGFIVNKKTNQLIKQPQLSESAIDDLLPS